MTIEKAKLIGVTFKIHPRLLEEIDKLIDNVHYRSRAHVINCAVDDWLKTPKKHSFNVWSISKKKHGR